jgi:hypothetical protein
MDGSIVWFIYLGYCVVYSLWFMVWFMVCGLWYIVWFIDPNGSSVNGFSFLVYGLTDCLLIGLAQDDILSICCVYVEYVEDK